MEENKKRRHTKWQVISWKISELLERTAICPIEGIKSEKCFLQDDFLTDPDNSNKVNEAIKIWSYKINNYTLREFFNMYNKNIEGDLIFSRSKTYLTLEESIEILDRLLIYQFDDDDSQIKEFLQNLVNVVDFQPECNPGSNIKCNTFLIHSPPSAGKNFFFDALFTLCLNLGQLGTANKSNNFAFQDAANRRIILWNEPNYESSMTDYLKTLFEGGDTKVRVKMLGDTHVKRTPIIILTNNHVNFMSDVAFKDRIKQYKWKTAPFLKECLLKPYPLSIFNILLKYEIKF
nr:MAG: rep 40 protein helicase [Chemarfal virus 36]